MNDGSQSWKVAVEHEDVTTVIFDRAPTSRENAVIVFGHGASSHLAHQTVVNLTDELRRHGLSTVRYNFLYTEAGKNPPDRMPRLMACTTSVIRSVREKINPSHLLAGGHSMGGRVASMLAAEDRHLEAENTAATDINGLILCGYPLHPAGAPEKLRSAHLSRIKIPVLCANGDRDLLCDRALMDPIVTTLPEWTMHWLAGADHSLHVQKRSGRTETDILAEFGQAVSVWLADHLHI